MTGFNTPSPYEIVDYSSYYNNDPQYDPWKAFDGLTGTYSQRLYVPVSNQHVTLDLGNSFDIGVLTQVDILPGNHISNDYNNRSVRDFTVYVSNDMLEWTNVLNVVGGIRLDGWCYEVIHYC